MGNAYTRRAFATITRAEMPAIRVGELREDTYFEEKESNDEPNVLEGTGCWPKGYRLIVFLSGNANCLESPFQG